MNDLNFEKNFFSWLKKKKWNLLNYQRDFFRFLSIQKYRQFIISSDIGTGKTITSFLPFFNYYCKGVNKKVLYISPLRSINSTLEKSLSKISSELKIDCNIQKRTSDDSYLKKKNNYLKFLRFY